LFLHFLAELPFLGVLSCVGAAALSAILAEVLLDPGIAGYLGRTTDYGLTFSASRAAFEALPQMCFSATSS